MPYLRRFRLRLCNLVRPGQAEAQLSREVASHLALIEEDFRRRGMTPDEARLAARRAFGGVEQTKEHHRDARSFAWLEDARRDVTYAVRTLGRNPGFAVVAVLTLALGIGANTAIFSVVRGVLLKPLPYKDSHRLVRLVVNVPATASPSGTASRSSAITVAELLEIRKRTTALSDVSFSGGVVFMTLTGRGGTARLQGFRVAPGLFDTLRAGARVGRAFGAAEEGPGGDAAIVLSYALWQRHFAGDPAIVGRTVALANTLAPNSQMDVKGYSVVGVMPQGFEFPDPQAQFWMPVAWAPSTRGGMWGRLADGASRQAAAAELGGLLSGLRHDRPGVTYELVDPIDGVVAPVKPALLVLTIAVGLVLLIACVNVANLLLARTAGRQREIAIRIALGAGRGRVLRQLLTESVMLALLGGAAGTGLALGGVRLLRTLATTLSRIDLGVQLPFPRLAEIGVDASVLAFALATAVGTGLLFGLAPAVSHAMSGPTETFRQGAATGAGFGLSRRNRLRGLLVIAEVAMAMTLFIGGGLLVHSFSNLARVELGYNPANVLTFQVTEPVYGAPGAVLKTFADQLVARLRSIPGVEAAAYARQLPMVAIKESAWFRKSPGLSTPPPPQSGQTVPDARLVSREYFEVLRIRVIAGRGFGDADVPGRPRAMLVNQTLARLEFPGQNPIGQHVYAGRDSEPWEVVGVVDDIRQFGLDQQPQPQFFADFRQWPETDPTFFTFLGPYYAVRTSGDPTAVVAQVRAIIGQLDATVGMYNVATMEQLVSNSISRPRMYTVLLGVFAGVAVMLAAIGIYGVMAYSVTQRTREIGIRMALGAQRGAMMGLVLRQSLLLIGVGIVLGISGAAAGTRYLEGMLFGLTPLDARTFAAVSLLFGAVAALASYLPARRATAVDPLVALRHD